MRKLRVVGLNFDHMHMGDLLRMCHEHPGVEIAGICDEDPGRMQAAIRDFGLGPDRVFTDARRCLERAAPDFVVLCPATARHAEYVELAAPFGVHFLVEKPFAATLAEADRMIAAARRARRLLAINWPLRWVPNFIFGRLPQLLTNTVTSSNPLLAANQIGKRMIWPCKTFRHGAVHTASGCWQTSGTIC